MTLDIVNMDPATDTNEAPIQNKVANSGLLSLDLELLNPAGERVAYDLAQHLWQGLVLREQQLRDELKATDWSAYAGKHVALFCSADAIIPTWAYMLVALRLQPVATTVLMGDLDQLESYLYDRVLDQLDLSPYHGAKVVVKGCSDIPVPTSAYVRITTLLLPVVQSLMFGEPCSTVPLWKKPKVANQG